ncbi:MAG: CheR family methyltransferase [Nitrospirota bacterium]
MKNILPLSKDDFSLFQRLLVEESGLHFDKDRSESLRLALWERLQIRGYESYQEYYNLLKFHPEGRLEIRELLDLITIGETFFFRNLPQFEALMRFVLPEIVQRRMHSLNKSIRVWSAGCSKGAEPYSIAIAMMEVLPSYENWDISILGTDINRNVLAYAKEAIYGERDIGHLPKEYLDRYFKIRGSNYILDARVRGLVRFEYHNLAKDPFTHEGMQDLDIIFCRNVIIYFDFQTTKQVIDNFHNCLIRDGYLFLGHAETLWQINNKFETVEFPQTFLYKKGLISVKEEMMKPFMAVPEIELENLTSIKETVTEKGVFPQELASGLQEKPEPLEQIEKPPDVAALSSPNHLIAQDKNNIRTYLTKATTLANEAKYKEAADIRAKIIEVDNLSVEAYYLLGVLSYKNSDLKEAETQFRKVIYVDPDSVLAYFNLGNMYLYQRKFSEAAREFRNVIRLLEKRPKDEQVKFCEDFTVEFLLRACRNNLVTISKRGE